ncbi:MAG: hypothetical protein GF416_02515 [Candidatus Altiarchaeales archaeon]|nr:hypothetical protein [Candidatus Altiarchaeales archaeon]MBD3415992.1 hypothetical protein [Candidatus Altiarchaeales archaeon]
MNKTSETILFYIGCAVLAVLVFQFIRALKADEAMTTTAADEIRPAETAKGIKAETAEDEGDDGNQIYFKWIVNKTERIVGFEWYAPGVDIYNVTLSVDQLGEDKGFHKFIDKTVHDTNNGTLLLKGSEESCDITVTAYARICTLEHRCQNMGQTTVDM